MEALAAAGPLLEHWLRRMRERFGLRFETVRGFGELQERRRELVQ
jgi:hypothetical protein